MHATVLCKEETAIKNQVIGFTIPDLNAYKLTQEEPT